MHFIDCLFPYNIILNLRRYGLSTAGGSVREAREVRTRGITLLNSIASSAACALLVLALNTIFLQKSVVAVCAMKSVDSYYLVSSPNSCINIDPSLIKTIINVVTNPFFLILFSL